MAEEKNLKVNKESKVDWKRVLIFALAGAIIPTLILVLIYFIIPLLFLISYIFLLPLLIIICIILIIIYNKTFKNKNEYYSIFFLIIFYFIFSFILISLFGLFCCGRLSLPFWFFSYIFNVIKFKVYGF